MVLIVLSDGLPSHLNILKLLKIQLPPFWNKTITVLCSWHSYTLWWSTVWLVFVLQFCKIVFVLCALCIWMKVTNCLNNAVCAYVGVSSDSRHKMSLVKLYVILDEYTPAEKSERFNRIWEKVCSTIFVGGFFNSRCAIMLHSHYERHIVLSNSFVLTWSMTNTSY